MTTPHPCRVPIQRRVVLGIALGLTLAASGQAADPAPGNSAGMRTSPPEPANPPDTVVLSPFEVNAAADKGYVSENIIAGSRLNSALKDVPANVNVFTQEFILDVAGHDLLELAKYDANVQPENFNVHGASNSGLFNDMTPSLRHTVRTRGLTTVFSRDFFPWYAPQDTYNVDRVDFSKGPNGVLFGAGAIGGAMNTASRRAVTHENRTEGSVQFGSWNLLRATLGTNLALVRDKLGVRIDLLNHEQDGYRYYTFLDKRRGSLAATYRPAAGTTMRASYENGIERRSAERPYGVVDRLSEWYFEGQRTATYTGGRAVAQPTSGIAALGANAALVYFDQGVTPGVYNMARSAQTTEYDDRRTDPVFRDNMVARRLYDDRGKFGPLSISDRINPGGPDNWAENRFSNASLVADHRFSPALQAELAFFYERLETNAQVAGGQMNLRADPNPLMGNASGNNPFANPLGPNPNVGGVYIERNAWRIQDDNSEQFSVRGSLAYEFDLGRRFASPVARRLGRHRLAGLLERHEQRLEKLRAEEVIGYAFRSLGWNGRDAQNNSHTYGLNGLWVTQAEQGQNLIERRRYVNFGDWKNFTMGRFPTSNQIALPQIQQTATTTFVPDGENNIADGRLKNNILMLGAQSFFLGDRLVTTLGCRVDDMTSDQAVAVRDAPQFTGGPADIDGDGEQYEWVLLPNRRLRNPYRASTRSVGAVFHATPAVSAFVNASTGSKLADIRQRVAPDARVAPNESGKSTDYGLIFNLFGGRISGRILRYETRQKDEFEPSTLQQPAALGTRIVPLLAAIRDSGGRPLLGAAEVEAHTPTFTGGLVDGESEGYEARVVGNVTSNLKWALNYSHTERRQFNVMKDLAAYLAGEKAFYAEKLATVGATINDAATRDGQSLLTSQGTIAEEIDSLEDRIIEFRSGREFGYAEAPHKVGTTLTYTVPGGSLQGLSLGGSVRWQSPINMKPLLKFNDVNGDFQIQFTELVLDANGNFIQEGVIKGDNGIFQLDLMARYPVRQLWGRRARLDLQLNVYNALDDRRVLPQLITRANNYLQQYLYQDPISFRFTARMSF